MVRNPAVIPAVVATPKLSLGPNISRAPEIFFGFSTTSGTVNHRHHVTRDHGRNRCRWPVSVEMAFPGVLQAESDIGKASSRSSSEAFCGKPERLAVS